MLPVLVFLGDTAPVFLCVIQRENKILIKASEGAPGPTYCTVLSLKKRVSFISEFISGFYI